MISWKPLSFDDKGYIEDILSQHPVPLSDYNFTNFWTWNRFYHFQHAFVDGFLCMKLAPPYFLYPIGQGSRIPIIEKLAQEAPDFQMRAIPEEAIGELAKYRLVAEEERFDYLYLYQDLLLLKGNRYQNKRNLIHQFRRTYNHNYAPIEVEFLPKIIEMEKSWYTQHADGEWLANEHEAALRSLHYFSQLNVTGGILLVNGEVIAYTVAEYVGDTIQIHIEKAFSSYKGAYQMMNQQLLQHLRPTLYVNREENLGFPHLRKAKESYHPIKKLKKFKLALSSRP